MELLKIAICKSALMIEPGSLIETKDEQGARLFTGYTANCIARDIQRLG